MSELRQVRRGFQSQAGKVAGSARKKTRLYPGIPQAAHIRHLPEMRKKEEIEDTKVIKAPFFRKVGSLFSKILLIMIIIINIEIEDWICFKVVMFLLF